MSETATVRLSREPAEWRDKGRAYKVVVDDREVGKIADGGTLAFQVWPGDHALHLRLDWVRSHQVGFSVGPGDVARFVCRARTMSALVFLQAIKSLFVRDGWIELERLE